MSRRPDDVAQVVLRALLAWPLLGVAVGAIVEGVVAWLYDDPRPLLAFGLGAGAGAGLAVACVELAVAPLRRRWWPGAAAASLLGLALVAPAPLLGGEFAVQLRALGSSRAATAAVVSAHERAPLELLALDAALSAALVASGLVVGRSLGWRPGAQAALGAWVVLVGAAVRLPAGRLEHTPLSLGLALELSLATLAPAVVELVDRALRAVRTGQRGRVRLLVTAASPAVVAVAWAAVLRGGAPSALGLLGAACAAGVTGGLLLVGAWRALGSIASRRPGRSHAALGLALLLGAGAALALRERGGQPPATGWEARIHLGLWWGADPIELLRFAEQTGARSGTTGPWSKVLDQRLRDAGLYTHLLTLAADRGDLGACRELTAPHLEEGSAEDRLRWLRCGAAQGDLDCATRLLSDSGSDDDLRLAADPVLRALDAGLLRPDPSSCAKLARVWERLPDRRPELEAGLVRAPERWLALVDAVVAAAGTPRAAHNPSRPTLALLARTLREQSRSTADAIVTSGPGATLLDLLLADPTLATEEDATHLRLTGRRGAWPPGLAALAPGPLDPERSPALRAAAEGDEAALWALTSRALADGARDLPALRARAHALLAVARRADDPEAALLLAAAHLARAGPPLDAPGAFDLALVQLHRALRAVSAKGQRVDAAELLATLDVALALAGDDAPSVQARVEPVRRLTVTSLGEPTPARMAAARARAAAGLRAQAASRPGLRAAADRLEALP